MKTMRLFIIVAMLIVGSKASFAQMAMSNDNAKQVTISGEVLDLSCYMANQAKGTAHQQCASTCIKAGGPMGLLTSDGKVYVLTSSHDHMDAYNQAKQHAAETISVTGSTYSQNGIMALEVASVKAGK